MIVSKEQEISDLKKEFSQREREVYSKHLKMHEKRTKRAILFSVSVCCLLVLGFIALI